MEKFINVEHISLEEIEQVVTKLKGLPTENRLLVVTPKEAVTKSGIFIGGDIDKDIIPKRGRVIQIGAISKEYPTFRFIKVGDFVTYGLYAGKEVELPYLEIDTKKFSITILSLTETLYVETIY